MVSLVMNPGRPDEQTFVLWPGTVTIGRTRENHVVCVHQSLSRRHARVDYDGKRLHVSDLQSKNGIFFKGSRVPTCDLVEGDSFACGDVTFAVRAANVPTRVSSRPVQAETLPSPLGAALRPSASPAQTSSPATGGARDTFQLRALQRACVLLSTPRAPDQQLDELVGVAAGAFGADRTILLVRDALKLTYDARVIKTTAPTSPIAAYSKRLVHHVASLGSPAAFDDVSKDAALGGDPSEDRAIRSAMAAPHIGAGVHSVLYTDTLETAGHFDNTMLATFRAFASLVGTALEMEALRRGRPTPARR